MEFDKDLQARQEARWLLHRAEAAQKQLAQFPQEKLDAIVKAIADAIDGAATELADMAVRETGFGNVEDKVAKISRTWGAAINSWVPAMEAILRQPMDPAGAPAFSAAAAAIFAAANVHCRALGWGEKTMVLPAFRAIMAL